MRLLLLVLFISACQTTNYVNRGDRLSFAGVPEGYHVKRQLHESWWEHYFLVGFISGRSETDLGNRIPLNDDEQCFNTKIRNEVPGGYIILQVLTQGVLPLIWSARETEVQCEVAVKNAAKAQEESPSPTPSPSPTVGE